VRIGSLELRDDLSPADWIVDRIHDFGVDVGSVIPEGFDAYARLFHPAIRIEDDVETVVRWSEVAEANGRTSIHRCIGGIGSPMWGIGPGRPR
jgi:hypothetical protein